MNYEVKTVYKFNVEFNTRKTRLIIGTLKSGRLQIVVNMVRTVYIALIFTATKVSL